MIYMYMQGILTKAVRWDVLKNSYYEDKEYEHEIRKKLDSPEVCSSQNMAFFLCFNEIRVQYM